MSVTPPPPNEVTGEDCVICHNYMWQSVLRGGGGGQKTGGLETGVT